MFNTLIFLAFLGREQPPLRGCVLKLKKDIKAKKINLAAASARLCVETMMKYLSYINRLAAASARLCVETVCTSNTYPVTTQPPLRGCVLKQTLKVI